MDPNGRTRIVTEGTGPYAICDDDMLIENFDENNIASFNDEFMNNGGRDLLYPVVDCGIDYFSIRYQKELLALIFLFRDLIEFDHDFP